MNNLGLLYEHGHGVNADGKEAMKLYLQAANLGNVQAAGNLARGYASGWEARETMCQPACG